MARERAAREAVRADSAGVEVVRDMAVVDGDFVRVEVLVELLLRALDGGFGLVDCYEFHRGTVGIVTSCGRNLENYFDM